MPHPTPPPFKRGCDLASEMSLEDEQSVVCLSCAIRLTGKEAVLNGWQLVPPVCLDCLRWEIVPIPESDFLIERYGRFWAVREQGTLLCVTVYKKGAVALVHRLMSSDPDSASPTHPASH